MDNSSEYLRLSALLESTILMIQILQNIKLWTVSGTKAVHMSAWCILSKTKKDNIRDTRSANIKVSKKNWYSRVLYGIKSNLQS